jgi:hypothetical protein
LSGNENYMIVTVGKNSHFIRLYLYIIIIMFINYNSITSGIQLLQYCKGFESSFSMDYVNNKIMNFVENMLCLCRYDEKGSKAETKKTNPNKLRMLFNIKSSLLCYV